jgi:hypothetical protein
MDKPLGQVLGPFDIVAVEGLGSESLGGFSPWASDLASRSYPGHPINIESIGIGWIALTY